jgi:hypothetical protein
MISLLVCYAVFALQANTLQQKEVVHLRPHHNVIESQFGGKLLELIDAPAVVHLPQVPQKLDDEGNPWCVDVKNLGPNAVTIVGKGQFSVQVNVGQTRHIYSNGQIYSLNAGGSP